MTALVEVFPNPSYRLWPEAIRHGDSVYIPDLSGSGSTLEEQSRSALESMQEVLARAGLTLGNVARVNAWVQRPEAREEFYQPWEALYPDRSDRPACKAIGAPLRPGCLVRLQVLARAGGRRTRVDIPGVPARDPTVAIGPWLFTSRVHGTDGATGEVPSDRERQVALAFENIGGLLQGGGFTTEDLTQLTAFARSQESFELATPHLAGLPASRRTDATHHQLLAYLSPRIDFMLEAAACHSEEDAFAEYILNPEHDPVPGAVRLGNLFYAPCILGVDGNGDLGDSFEAQLEAALGNLRRLLQKAGAGLEHVAHVTVYFQDVSWRPRLNAVWERWFPDPDDRPPHKYLPVTFAHPGAVTALQVYAFPGHRRRVLKIPDVSHQDPMAMGVEMAGHVFSSRLFAYDPVHKTSVQGLSPQTEVCLQNMDRLLLDARLDRKDLTQVKAYVRAPGDAGLLLESLPQAAVMITDLPGLGIRLEITASGDSRAHARPNLPTPGTR